MLSRLLYPLDEVYVSFITELLLGKNIDVCLFWMSELHYSKENIVEFIWKIYFDFYAELNPKLESYLKRKMSLYFNTNALQDIFDSVENLFVCTATSTVFLLRQYEQLHSKPLILYKKTNSRKWDWLQRYPSEYHTLLKALHKNNLICASTELRNIMKKNTSQNVYETIISYFSKHIVLVSSETIQRKWSSRTWYDDYHGLLALIAHLSTEPQDIKRQYVFKKTDKSILDEYELCHKDIENRHNKKNRVHTILFDYRTYKLHHGAKVFTINKTDSNIDFKKLTENWIYYVCGCELWKSRINEYGGVINHAKKSVEFKFEEKESEFYDRYYLEFDEQPKDIQNMSDDMKYITGSDKITWDVWHAKLFDGNPIVQFPDDFRFTY